MDVTLPPPAGTAGDDHPFDSPDRGDDVVPASADTGIIGSVAAHLGRQLGFDPLWIRIGFVLLTLVGGVGVLVYVGLWLAVVLGSRGWRLAEVAGATVLLAGLPTMLLLGGVPAITGWFAIVVLLAGLAVALWQPRRMVVSAPVLPVRQRTTRVKPAMRVDDPDTHDAFWATGPVVPPRRPRREPSQLGRATVGLAIVVAAVGALVDDGNGGRFHPEQWLGAAALVCAIGLIVGTVAGRGRWLVLPAIVLAGAGFVSGEFARVGVPLGAMSGDAYSYVAPELVGSHSVEAGVGDVYLQIDAAPAGEVVVDARAVFGTIFVQVGTRDVEVEVRPRTDRGGTRVDGSGIGDGEVVVLNEGRGGDGRVVVEAWTAIGDVVVYSANASGDGPVPLATVPPVLTVVPAGAQGDLVTIDPYVSATVDGWIVLANGEVVIDPDDRVVTGTTIPLDGAAGDGQGVAISTGLGEYRLLPRSLLLTPDGRIVDLLAVRESLMAQPVITQPEAPLVPTLPPVPVTEEEGLP